ncbi:MAG TPA: ATP-binding protein, partial [Anaerolineae bacterium]|nr:ATP-binding protein [Anaerolineae bacterium]
MASKFGVEEPYRQKLFVNRKKHLQWIRGMIKQIQSGRIAESPIVNIWGVRGIGKSWLISHLQQLYQHDGSFPDELSPTPTFTLFYRFPKEQVSQIDNEDFVDIFLTQIQKQLQQFFFPYEQAAFEQAGTDREIASLTNLLAILSERFVPVILLDQTESVFDDWARLEKSFIEPLAMTNRVVFVIAGRRPIPEWLRFETRRRVAPLDLSRLNGFTKEDIREQINRLSGRFPDIDDIYKWSATSPRIARELLKESERRLGKDLITSATWKQHQSEILPPVYQAAVAYLFEGIPDRLIKVLKAVSALRYYRLEGIRHMLTLQKEEEQPYNYYLKLIRSLEQNTEYVWWNRERRAYTTSRVVRSLLNQEQLLTNSGLFVQQHQQAIEMYEGWVNEYPEASEDFILEIWFHRANIFTVTEDAEALEQELKNELA